MPVLYTRWWAPVTPPRPEDERPASSVQFTEDNSYIPRGSEPPWNRLYFWDQAEAKPQIATPDDGYWIPPKPWPETSSRPFVGGDDSPPPQLRIDDNTWQAPIIWPVPLVTAILWEAQDQFFPTAIAGDEGTWSSPVTWATINPSSVWQVPDDLPVTPTFGLQDDPWFPPASWPESGVQLSIGIPRPNNDGVTGEFGLDDNTWSPPVLWSVPGVILTIGVPRPNDGVTLQVSLEESIWSYVPPWPAWNPLYLYVSDDDLPHIEDDYQWANPTVWPIPWILWKPEVDDQWVPAPTPQPLQEDYWLPQPVWQQFSLQPVRADDEIVPQPIFDQDGWLPVPQWPTEWKIWQPGVQDDFVPQPVVDDTSWSVAQPWQVSAQGLYLWDSGLEFPTPATPFSLDEFFYQAPQPWPWTFRTHSVPWFAVEDSEWIPEPPPVIPSEANYIPTWRPRRR